MPSKRNKSTQKTPQNAPNHASFASLLTYFRALAARKNGLHRELGAQMVRFLQSVGPVRGPDRPFPDDLLDAAVSFFTEGRPVRTFPTIQYVPPTPADIALIYNSPALWPSAEAPLPRQTSLLETPRWCASITGDPDNPSDVLARTPAPADSLRDVVMGRFMTFGHIRGRPSPVLVHLRLLTLCYAYEHIAETGGGISPERLFAHAFDKAFVFLNTVRYLRHNTGNPFAPPARMLDSEAAVDMLVDYLMPELPDGAPAAFYATTLQEGLDKAKAFGRAPGTRTTSTRPALPFGTTLGDARGAGDHAGNRTDDAFIMAHTLHWRLRAQVLQEWVVLEREGQANALRAATVYREGRGQLRFMLHHGTAPLRAPGMHMLADVVDADALTTPETRAALPHEMRVPLGLLTLMRVNKHLETAREAKP